MRKLLVTLVVLAVLAVAADVLAARVAQSRVAAQVQEAVGLPAPPEVEVRGRPFLLQVVRGSYDDVVVRAVDVPGDALSFDRVVAQLQGVEVSLVDALSGSVEAVPVDRVSFRALLGYDDLTAVVQDRGLQVSDAGGGLLRVTGSREVLGQTLAAAAISRPTLEGSTLVVTAERYEVGNDVANDIVSAALGDQLDVRIELAPPPFGLQLTGLLAGPDGVAVTARGTDVVLR